MVYTKAELNKSSRETAFCFGTNTIGHMSEKHLPIPAVITVAFDHNSTIHNSFIGIPNCMRN
jgi:hypothetical protein